MFVLWTIRKFSSARNRIICNIAHLCDSYGKILVFFRRRDNDDFGWRRLVLIICGSPSFVRGSTSKWSRRWIPFHVRSCTAFRITPTPAATPPCDRTCTPSDTLGCHRRFSSITSSQTTPATGRKCCAQTSMCIARTHDAGVRRHCRTGSSACSATLCSVAAPPSCIWRCLRSWLRHFR